MNKEKESAARGQDSIKNAADLEFAIFCIESTAAKLGVNPSLIYKKFVDESDILYSYILPCAAALHTQSKEYIVNDILTVMRQKGIA